MGNIKRRLEKVEKSLTPKQAVIAWMGYAHRFDSLHDYGAWLVKQPADFNPLFQLLEQVRESVLRNRKIEELNEGERESLREATTQAGFLFHLNLGVNENFLERSRAIAAQAIILAERLRAELDRESMRENRLQTLRHFAELPYPLTESDGACVSFALGNAVMTFAHLEDARADLASADGTSNRLRLYARENGVAEWVRMHFVRQGKTFLQTGPVQNSAYGFADVTDAEFEERVHSIVAALKTLASSGAIVAMRQLFLPSVPIAPLQRVPIVEHGWVDACVIELAEIGALLREKGFQIEPSLDPHPLAWPRIFPPPRTAESEETVMQEAVQHLSDFPGESRLIEGRKFLRLDDYSAWSDRQVRGRLQTEDGFSVASFNAWLERNTTAPLAGIMPDHIFSAITDSSFVAYPDSDNLELALLVREEAIAGLREPIKLENSLDGWREIFVPFATEILTTISVVEYIEQKYFDGHTVLWKSSRDELEQFQQLIQKLLDIYHEQLETPLTSSVVSRKGRREKHRIDLDALTRSIDPAKAAQQLIDLAKVETLQMMGARKRAQELLASMLEG